MAAAVSTADPRTRSRPAQSPTTSPPARVVRAAGVHKGVLSARNRTDPSAIANNRLPSDVSRIVRHLTSTPESQWPKPLEDTKPDPLADPPA
jgi:hypothetical protein